MKNNRLNLFLVALLGVVALSFAAIGCSPSGSDGANASSDLEKQFPQHAASVDAGEGEAGFHAQLGQSCESCHTGDMSADVAAFVDANGEPPLSSAYYMDNQVCLDCHGGTWEELAKSTADLGEYNPHDSLHGTIENCNECHKGHSSQVDLCGECHDNGGQTMKGIVGGLAI